jgi:hypothetical protein
MQHSAIEVKSADLMQGDSVQRQGKSSDKMGKIPEEEETKQTESTEIECGEEKVELKDDEPLLIGKFPSTDYEEEAGGESRESPRETKMPMNERIEMHTAANISDDASSAADDDTTGEDEESQEEVDVAYVEEVPEDDPDKGAAVLVDSNSNKQT